MTVEIGITRILQIFVFQLFIGLFFVYLGVEILKKNKSRLNITFGLFYLFPATGVFLNIIYSLIDIHIAVVILNYLTNFSISVSTIFLYCTNKILLESEKVFSKKKQIRIILIYAIALAFMGIFYPFDEGVMISEATEWRPVWQFSILIYVYIVLTFGLIGIIHTSIKILKDFKDEKLHKKWKIFIIGVIGLFTYMYGAYLSNYIDQEAFRVGFNIFGITLILWIYLIYYGIGRQID
ncbi:MAG: hypothetical protein ACOC35_14695 [Promethearchaeia archaeon]